MSDGLAEQVQHRLLEKRMYLVTAESCTGGMLSVAMTDVSGSSRVFDRAFVTYSNEAKMDVLEVKPETLEEFGAVSAETAKEMAEGSLKKAIMSHISIAVTGIAGPDGGTPTKPVGLVFIAIGQQDKKTIVYRHEFKGDRDAVRQQTVDTAFNHVLEILST